MVVLYTLVNSEAFLSVEAALWRMYVTIDIFFLTFSHFSESGLVSILCRESVIEGNTDPEYESNALGARRIFLKYNINVVH